MHIALVEPEIPGNTGSIARTCVGTGTPLHLVGKLGFSLEDRYLKRAGLDYWPRLSLHLHQDLDEVLESLPAATPWLFTKTARQSLWDVRFSPGDLLVFGSETRGLPAPLLERFPDRRVRIPISADIRSLNLANAATVGLFEALRQTGWSPDS